jgi:hypothetical protein
VHLTLWVDGREEPGEAANPNATLMLALQALRNKTASQEESLVEVAPGVMARMTHVVANQTIVVYGPAILTGAGGEALPETDWQCLIAALMGQHE